MISAIKEDIYRYHGGNYNKLTIKLANLYKPYTRYMYFFRKAQFAKNRFSKQFWCILLKNLKIQIWGSNSGRNKDRTWISLTTFWISSCSAQFCNWAQL